MPLRDHYRPIIASIIARVGTAAMKQLRKTLRDEFPDPPRAYHPYKVWLDEIAVQLKTKGKRKQERKVKQREAADNEAGQGNFFKE